MGCGGSTEAANPSTQYLEGNASEQGAGKGGKQPCDNTQPPAPKTRKVVDHFKVNVATIKSQRVRRKGDPRSQFPAAAHVGEGTRDGHTTTQTVTMVPAISVTQLATDMQNRNLLRSLCCGYMAVERTGPSCFAPTPLGVRPLNVLDGAEAPYTVLWSAPDDRGDRIASHFADDAAALDMLRSRLVPTEYAGARLRYFAGMAKAVRSIAISKNGKLAAAATRRRAFLPNASSLSNVRSDESGSSSNSSRRRAYHLENLELAVRLYNVNTSEHVGYFRDGTDTQCTVHMEFLWDLTDNDLLTGTEEGFVRTLASGRLNVKAEMSSDSERVIMVAVCPSDSVCAVADNANTVSIFSLSSKERTSEFTGHAAVVTSVGFHPTHQLVVSSCMKKVLIWRANSGVTVQEIVLANVRKAFFGGNLKLYMLLPESLQCWTADMPLELSVQTDSSAPVAISEFTHSWTKFEGKDEPSHESNALTTENSLAKPRRYRDATYLPGHAILLFAADEKVCLSPLPRLPSCPSPPHPIFCILRLKLYLRRKASRWRPSGFVVSRCARRRPRTCASSVTRMGTSTRLISNWYAAAVCCHTRATTRRKPGRATRRQQH